MSLSAFARDVAARLHHRGALISPDYSNIAADLKEIAATDFAALSAAIPLRQRELVASYGLTPSVQDKPFAFSNGVAIIPVHGILLNKMNWGSSYATGYNYIRNLYQAAEADSDVRAIVYDVNSPGGMGAGCSELADELAGHSKPSLAVVDAAAYSAAYWLASAAADHIAVTPSGGAGSIGVVAMHVDYSGALEQEGIKVSFVHAGKEKVDGNPFEALSDRARETIQRDVDALYGQFVSSVATHRDLGQDAVRATEARCYLPEEAQSLGLTDSVAAPAAALRQFLEGGTMTTAATVTATDIRAEVEAALRADRARQSAIRNCPEADGRQELAEHLALDTDLSVDAARTILGKAAKAPVARNAFNEAMGKTPNPEIGQDHDGNGAAGADTPEARAALILRDYAKVTGNKVKVAA